MRFIGTFSVAPLLALALAACASPQLAAIAVKDTIDVAGTATTAGSLALVRNIAEADATVVARLRSQGALILGKTNLSEWSNFRAGGIPAGWSAVGGQTRNPYDPARSPCGSSSGSAVAVAAGFAPIALGAETNGSLICPASVNGVVGFKPTVGLLPRDGLLMVSRHQDTIGPIARTVDDIALAMDVMTTPEGEPVRTAYRDGLGPDLGGLRIGVFRWAQGSNPEVTAVFDQAVSVLAAAGAILVEIDEFSPDPATWNPGADVLANEWAASLEAFLASTPATVTVRTVEDLIAFNATEPAEHVDRYGQSLLEQTREASDVDLPAHLEAVAAQSAAARERGVDLLLGAYQVDVVVMPASPPAAPRERDPDFIALNRNLGATWLPAMAGYPMLTVPMGEVQGLPVGLGVFASGGQDALVLKVGYAFEQAAGVRLRPDLP